MSVNLEVGLRRLSVVWWGFWMALGIALFCISLFGDSSRSDRWTFVGAGLAVASIAFFAHKVTCWIVAGFFSQRS